MAASSTIECDSTFNPWIGCTAISPACEHCYAEAQMSTRLGRVKWGAGQPRQRTSAGNWRQPVRWNARSFWQCDTCGWRGENPHLDGLLDEGAQVRNMCPGCWPALVAVKPARRRVFCASLADWLDNEVDVSWLADLLSLIHATPNLDWLLLTKRIGNWKARMNCALGSSPLPGRWLDGNPPRNVWLGATVCNQTEADRDIPKMLTVPARVRFLSIEPMLGAINLASAGAVWADMNNRIIDGAAHGLRGIGWVICGGESGPHARPLHPDWVRSLRDQCEAAGVPFLFKQWGEWKPISEMPESEYGALYRPNRIAQPHEDQAALDELYGRTCKVQTDGIGYGGARGSESFLVVNGKGGMQMFKVGKRAAGRFLDGVEHNGFPVVTP